MCHPLCLQGGQYQKANQGKESWSCGGHSVSFIRGSSNYLGIILLRATIFLEYVNGQRLVWLHPNGYLMTQQEEGWQMEQLLSHTQPVKVCTKYIFIFST